MGNKFWIPSLVLVIGSSAVVTAVIAKPKPTPRPISTEQSLMSVPVSEANPSVQRLDVTASGTVVPSRQIDLVAEVSGRIVAINRQFETGGHFQAGEWLVRIDPADYQMAVVAAKARLAEASRLLAEEKGRARQAKREWRDLGNQEANDLFIRKPQLAAAEANLILAQADLAKAERDLAKTEIRLPFDGRIRSVRANIGQFVGAGTALGSAFDTASMEVRVPLSERQAALVELPFVESMAPAEVKLYGVVAGKEATWTGKLARTDAYVDEQSRMYYAIVEVADPFKNTAAPLLPGLFVEARIEGKALNGVTLLPRDALYQKNILVTLDAENKAQHKVIDVLNKTEEQVWVRGIAKGEKVLLAKQSLVTSGDQVEPVLATEPDQSALSLSSSQP